MTDLNIGPKYARFFLKNLKTRHVLLCGSRRSGKSYSIFKWMTLRSLGTEPIHTIICTSSFPSTTLAIADFQDATGLTVVGSAVHGMHVSLPNGSLIQFKSFDDPTKAQGTHCDYLIAEEALNIPEQILNVVLLGVRKQAYFVFNPTRSGIIDKYILKDKSNYLVTTFKDNPYLGESQIEEFELMKQKALSPTASPIDIYNYKVYYCGEFQSMAGKVFTQVYTVTDDEYLNIPAGELKAMDFGFVNSKDATCLVGVKIYNNCLYVKEYFYSSQLANNKELAFTLHDYHISEYEPIVADYGGMGAEKIKILASAKYGEWTEPEICNGFNIVNAKKARIIDSLNKVLNYDKIYVTESSNDLRDEFDRYEINAEGKEVSKHENCISAMRYAVTSYDIHIYN